MKILLVSIVIFFVTAFGASGYFVFGGSFNDIRDQKTPIEKPDEIVKATKENNSQKPRENQPDLRYLLKIDRKIKPEYKSFFLQYSSDFSRLVSKYKQHDSIDFHGATRLALEIEYIDGSFVYLLHITDFEPTTNLVYTISGLSVDGVKLTSLKSYSRLVSDWITLLSNKTNDKNLKAELVKSPTIGLVLNRKINKKYVSVVIGTNINKNRRSIKYNKCTFAAPICYATNGSKEFFYANNDVRLEQKDEFFFINEKNSSNELKHEKVLKMFYPKAKFK